MRPMVYCVLADLVLVLHLAFILFSIVGGLLALRWSWAPLVQLPGVAWGVFIEVSGGICPLTPLENALRRAAGESGYAGGFIEHYFVALIYPDELSRPIQFLLAGFVLVANASVYWLVWRRRKCA